MKYKYFGPFIVILICFVLFLFDVQNRIKKDNLSNFSIYQNSISQYVSFKFSQFLRARMAGLSVISSLENVKRRDMERIPMDMEDYYKYVREQYVKGIFLYDENGLVIYSTFEKEKGSDHSNTDFFKWCKEEGKKGKFFALPFLHMEYKKSSPSLNLNPSDLFVITPVFAESNGNKIFSGAIAIIIDLKGFVEKNLFISDVWEFSEVLVLWSDGTVIYSRSHPEMERRNVKEKDCLRCHSSLALFHKALEEPSGDFEFYFGDERKIVNFQTVQVEDFSFRLFIYTPYKKIVGLAQRGLTGTFLLTLALIFAFTLSFFMFMRSRTQKIKAEEKVQSLRTRLELEEKLRKTEEKFYTFGNITSDGIWLYKINVPVPVDLPVEEQVKMILEYSYLSWCNDSMAQMYGLDRKEELIGKPLKETLNPEDPRNIELLRAFVRSGYNLKNYESYEKDIHGKTHVFLNSLQGIIKERNLIEAWGSQKDLTEIKEIEEERKRLENQLFQVQKMEAVGRLTGGVAHDFNNILTSIIGNAELSLSGIAPSDPNYRRIRSILESARKASNLTRKLLTFSKKQLEEPVVSDLNDVIRSMDDILRRTIGEDINFILSLEKNLKPVEIETIQMEQVIMNLVLNSREAMPEGGTLIISTRNVLKSDERCVFCSEFINGEFVELSISDTGVGIPEEIRNKIFEPFYSTKKDGIGLGLSIVYGAVSQMKGHLNIESKLGEGTTFSVYLPVYKGEKEKVGKRIMVGTEEISGGDETILFVEDEKDILEIMRDFLAELGYEVITASSAEDAVEKIKEISRLDFLVTDVILPGKKGPDFAREIRVIYPQIKVLFISGYTEDRLSAQAVWEGEISFLAKPFTPFVLAKKIREILDS